ncbi:MAG: T9SS type A sorting domain-containing protein [Chitinophagaceae bacterium]|nr:T9SS type A sorting domain-containing protein [Chitinophagaceae bacterium]
MKNLIKLILCYLLVSNQVYAQTSCNTFLAVINSLSGTIPKIFPTNTSDYYVTGLSGTSPTLIQYNTFGVIDPTRTWKLNSFIGSEEIADLKIDQSNSNQLFGIAYSSSLQRSTVFKMNRTTGAILWAIHFNTTTLTQIHQSSTSNLIVTGTNRNTQTSFIANMTTAGVVGTHRTFNGGIPGDGEFYSTLASNNKLYGSCRRYYSASTDFRSGLWEYNYSAHSIPWHNTYISNGMPTNNTRIYPVEPEVNVVANNIFTLSSGDLVGFNVFGLGPTELVVNKSTLTGSLFWTKQYVVAGRTRMLGTRILKTTNGYYVIGNLYSNNINNLIDRFFVFKIDVNGLVQWTKLYGISGQNKVLAAFESGGFLHLSALTDSYGGTNKVLMLKLDNVGNANTNCNFITTATTTVSTLTAIRNPLVSTLASPAISTPSANMSSIASTFSLNTFCCPCSISPSITGANSICAGNSSVLTASGGVSYVWNTGATTSTLTVTPTANTSYTVTATDANGCTGTSVFAVNILNGPSVNISGPTTICPNQTQVLTASGGGTYLWSPGGATTSSISITNPGTYCVTATGVGPNLISNGDFSGGNVGFTSGYNYSGVSSPCNYTVNSSFFGGAMLDHSPSADNMFMSVDGCNTSFPILWQQTVSSVVPSTNYTFSFWVVAGSVNTPTFTIKINGASVGTWTPLALWTTVPVWEQYSVSWNSGSSTSANIVLENTQPAGYGNDFGLDDFSLGLTGCSASTCYTVVPCCSDMNVNYTYITSNLPANSIYLNAPVVSGCNGVLSYEWDLGNGQTSTLASPGLITYNTPCEKTICLKVICTNQDSSVCIKNCCKTIIIPGSSSMLNTNFGYTISSSNPLDIGLTAPSSVAGTSYVWNVYQGTTLIHTATTPAISSLILPSAGTYKVCLTSKTSNAMSCTSVTKEQCKLITVYAPCNVLPSMSITQQSSQNAYTIQFANNSTGASSASMWDFGDGTALDYTTNPIHTYAAVGTYTVCLTANLGDSNCQTTICNVIQISEAICDSTTNGGQLKTAQSANQGEGIFNSKVASVPTQQLVLENEQRNLTIYPNPVHDGNLNIELLTTHQGKATVKIIDMIGHIIKVQDFTTCGNCTNLFSLDVNQLPSGMYTTQVLESGKMFTGKFSISK